MLTSKQIIMLRPLSLSTDVCVQVDYTTVPSKSEVTISDLIDLYMYTYTCSDRDRVEGPALIMKTQW